MAAIGIAGFFFFFKAKCENHGGQGSAAIQQWDAKKGNWLFIAE